MNTFSASPTAQALADLFARARTADEFEFACTLLRVSGMHGPGWDPLQETFALTGQIAWLLNGPITEDLRRRLAVFLYCHLLESPTTYHIPRNLLRVVRGERYSLSPFGPEPPRFPDPAMYPVSKIKRIITAAQDQGMPSLVAAFDGVLLKPVRNAFFHSQYVITPTHFNYGGPSLEVDGVLTTALPWGWLAPRLDRGIELAGTVQELTIAHALSYRENKVVAGRFAADGSVVPVELLTDPVGGLKGFRSPPSRGAA